MHVIHSSTATLVSDTLPMGIPSNAMPPIPPNNKGPVCYLMVLLTLPAASARVLLKCATNILGERRSLHAIITCVPWFFGLENYGMGPC